MKTAFYYTRIISSRKNCFCAPFKKQATSHHSQSFQWHAELVKRMSESCNITISLEWLAYTNNLIPSRLTV